MLQIACLWYGEPFASTTDSRRNPLRRPIGNGRAGGLLVDRVNGHVSAINLPEFDPVHSAAGWYRDYAAYCGVSEDGKKVFAVVAQISRRKPVLKMLLDGATLGGEPRDSAAPDSACSTPDWQRAPARVTFEVAGSPKQTFAIRGHTVDLIYEGKTRRRRSFEISKPLSPIERV
jgi:hypothetical protein